MDICKNEYKVSFRNHAGTVVTGFIYGDNEDDARKNAIAQGINPGKIVSIQFNEPYRGYGHL